MHINHNNNNNDNNIPYYTIIYYNIIYYNMIYLRPARQALAYGLCSMTSRCDM